MMDLLCYALAGLFLLKLLWNIAVPFVALQRLRRWEVAGGVKPGAISLVPIVEILLLVMLVSAIYMNVSLGLQGSIFLVALAGILAIVVSYFVTALLTKFLGKRYRQL